MNHFLRKINIILAITLAVGCFVAPSSFAGDNSAAKIPIQNNGRIKSLDAFARETVQLISGREHWDKKSALTVIVSHLHDPSSFLDVKFVRLDHLELKKMFGLAAEQKYFSYNELKPFFPHLYSILQGVKEKRNQEVKLSTLEQNCELLYNRLNAVDALARAEIFKFIPSEKASGAWMSPYQSDSDLAVEFKRVVGLYSAQDSKQFAQASQQWISNVTKISPDKFTTTLSLERCYYTSKPFFFAWIFYLVAFVLMGLSKKRGESKSFVSIVFLVLGFAMHTHGLFLRVLILQRPPVSNMYESMIFMNWVLMVCALGFYFVRRNSFFLTSGALVSALVMIFADLLPVDKSLGVLVPVLNSSYWLMIHVLTIVSSYGIFGLAMALGHRHLYLDATRKFKNKDEDISADVLNRLLQIGLITLGAGTILGGVWANESWGRFWGWDPKETWAFITFLGYLILLHLRVANKLDNFFLALGSVLGFLLVLMTWYGVNFVLGRGLHSYGFGAGGVTWVICYLVFEFVFLGFIGAVKFKLLTFNTNN